MYSSCWPFLFFEVEEEKGCVAFPSNLNQGSVNDFSSLRLVLKDIPLYQSSHLSCREQNQRWWERNPESRQGMFMVQIIFWIRCHQKVGHFGNSVVFLTIPQKVHLHIFYLWPHGTQVSKDDRSDVESSSEEEDVTTNTKRPCDSSSSNGANWVNGHVEGSYWAEE